MNEEEFQRKLVTEGEKMEKGEQSPKEYTRAVQKLHKAASKEDWGNPSEEELQEFEEKFWENIENPPTYILKDNVPVPEPDRDKWREWMQTASLIVEKDIIVINNNSRAEVCTRFLGKNAQFMPNCRPLFFETRFFGVDLHESHRLFYSTWDEAVAGHKKRADKAKSIILGKLR